MKTKIIAQDINNIDICALLKANNCAGKIGVVYKEGDNKIADGVVRAIERGGNLVKRVAYPSDVQVNDCALADLLSMPEEIRYIVAIGDRSISELASCCERDYILILTELNTAEYLSPSVMLDGCIDTLEARAPLAVCINKTSLESSAENLAKAYACIIAHYSILPDMWYNSCFSAVNTKYLDGVDKVLQRLASRTIERNSDDTLSRIIRANIDLAELNDGVSHEERAIFIGARFAAMDVTQELDCVEIGALWTAYIYNYLTKLLPTYCENLRFPTDLSELVDSLSAMSGIDCAEIMRRMPRVRAEDVITRDYVLIEYKDDLFAKLTEKVGAVNMAIKQLKRLYDDAGLRLTRAIKVVDFKREFLSSVVVIPMYTLPKHLCFMGILS